MICLVALAAACGADLTTTRAFGASESQPSSVFPNTFALIAGTDGEAFHGRWRSLGHELILIARADRAGRIGLFGAIPDGRHEGALWLSRLAGNQWSGTHLSAISRRRVPALAARSTAGRLTLDIAGSSIVFDRAGPVNADMIRSVSIYGHRAGGLGQQAYANTLAAIADSWLLGSSGVEIDVTVPFTSGRQPLPGDLRVHHPSEWRSEILRFDSTEASRLARAPRLSAALHAATASSLAGVYVDAKLKWLVRDRRDAAAAAIANILRESAATPELSVVIGAETSGPGEAADMLADARRSHPFPAHVRWALEITRGTDVSASLARVVGPAGPDALSWNLLALSGGGGGALRWFVRTVPDDVERALVARGLPYVLWTAASDQFDAAVSVLSRLRRNGAEAAIMTPYPHRLAFYLATRP